MLIFAAFIIKGGIVCSVLESAAQDKCQEIEMGSWSCDGDGKNASRWKQKVFHADLSAEREHQGSTWSEHEFPEKTHRKIYSAWDLMLHFFALL